MPVAVVRDLSIYRSEKFQQGNYPVPAASLDDVENLLMHVQLKTWGSDHCQHSPQQPCEIFLQNGGFDPTIFCTQSERVTSTRVLAVPFQATG